MLCQPLTHPTPDLPRNRIEAAIEALIALLDATEPDPDLEDSDSDCDLAGADTDLEDGNDHGIADLGGLGEQWGAHPVYGIEMGVE
ncbi:hypothetical protein JF546_19605 [Nitratireductor aquimarinus]|uniref:hypothetical protein n=1 Tax=Nitratireductor aquimarinus TaxID=889300 RepID=UPI001A8C6436|nr:hypothetical protein [Nitratireductor aquimarinus]MBN8245227.1 hypothetical protein [Nitratireductor aquimarinus]MBY6133612.1 hypothetical protein [Nitratireductor aquimarinus]MCA1304737.1 hypothetical protein [Nitratireductor aquimarinus]